MTRHRLAIYVPRSTGMYERAPRRVGGAERQMVLLARALAARGVPVAHIVFAPTAPAVDPRGPALVTRAPYEGERPVGKLKEAWHVWRALRAADSDAYLLRGASPAVSVAALYCRLRRRRLIFSSANDLDFTLERMADRRVQRALYRWALRSASAIVVQSRRQAELAQRLGGVRRVERIASFGDPTPEEQTPVAPEAFLWIGRLIDYKEPLRYLELARELPEARFWMIGIANESLDYAERVRAAAAGVPNVEMLDQRPHGDTMELMRRAIALVSTSTREGMPNVFLEAWARGIPVLSLSFDPDDVMREQQIGIATDGDFGRFVDAARRLLQGETGRAELASRAREHIMRTHDPEAVGRQWLALVEELSGAPDRR